MTIQELMDRIAGDDLEWVDVAALGEVGNNQVHMATLGAVDEDGKPFIFRLPVEKLRKRSNNNGL